MIKKISRDLCIIKYRKLPLCEHDKEIDDEICYYPKIEFFYWLKLEKKLEKNSSKNLPKEIVSLFRKLNIDNLIFLSRNNKTWISKHTESRKDFKPLINSIDYFKRNKIAKRFNGGVKVSIELLEEFLVNFYIITECDSSFFDYNFTDENENFLFYIHYSGEFKVLVLNEKANKDFLSEISKTNFIDSERGSWNHIK